MSLGPEIASALVELKVEVSNQQIDAAAVKAAQEFNRVFANTQKTLAARDKASQAAAAASIAQAFGGIAKQLDIVTPKLTAFQQVQKGLTATMDKFGGSMTGAAVGVGLLTAAAVKLTASFAKTAGDFQELEQGINAIIENSDTANTTTEKFIGNLRSLALESGRSSTQLANTGRQFLALGFSGDDTTRILNTFTKAAALTGATNQQLGLALNGVSQIASKGAVSMEELRRQIAENLPGAVNLSRFFEILASNMGITVKEAKKLQGQGLIGAEEGIKALLQAVNETTEGIDVFALRAKTLNGILGIIKEGFSQAVQTGFQPFIKAITEASSGPLGQLIQGLRGGQSAMSGFSGLIERFGTVMGKSFVDVLNKILPLIPGIAEAFVSFTEAFAPVVVDTIEAAANFAKLLLPAINAVADALKVLFNDLGPVSDVLRALASGALIGGIVRAFGLFGRAAGSVGGFLGRVATPLTKIFNAFSDLAGPIGAVTTVLSFLGDIIEPLISSVDNLRTIFIALGIAILTLKLGSIASIFTSIRTAIAGLALTAKATTFAIGGLRNALLLGGVSVAAAVVINGIIDGFQRAKKAGDELKESLTSGIATGNLSSLDTALAQAEAKFEQTKKRFGAQGGLLAAIAGTQQVFNPFADNKIQEAQAALTGANDAVEELRRRAGSARGVLDAVFAQTGASASKVISVLNELGIEITNIAGDKVPEIITKVIDHLNKATEEAGSFTAQLNAAFTSAVDNVEKLEKAQKAVDDAQKARTDAVKAEADARKDVTTAIEHETAAKEKLDDINTKLAEAEAERLKLINDTTSDIREIAEAQRELEKIGFRLLDIDSQRKEILEKIKELQAPATADEIAAADNKITRATINLNRAKREEQELLDQLNKTQQTSVDLSGLSLDQLRIRLAGIRLSLAAQRSITKSGKTQEELQEGLTEAHINTVDAQIELNEAIADRSELDTKVIQNQVEIERLTRNLKTLDIDIADLKDDQITKTQELILLQGGETTRAGELKKVEEEIRNLKRDQRDAAKDVQTATADIQIKQDLVKIATQGIRDAEKEIRQAKIDQRLEVATILGTEKEINNALRDRLGLNGQLGQQTSQIVAQSLINNFIPNLPDIDKVGVEAFVGTSIKSPNFAKKLAEMILNNPNRLRDMLRFVGISGFEQGGLITSPTVSMMGEKFKHEMVLPLTKPDRVWSLMSQTLPKYPGALQAAQSALSSTAGTQQPLSVNLGSKRVVPRNEGPATYGQIEELIKLLREQRTEVRVEAPITIEQSGTSEDLLVRKISRKVERNLLDKLGRR